jgi:hypothetical protein
MGVRMMIDSAHDVEALGGYALGALTPEEAQAVEDHLTGCPTCRTELDQLVGVRSMLDRTPADAFVPKLSRRRSAIRFGLLAAAAAIIGLAIGTGVLIGQTRPSAPTFAAPPEPVVSAPPSGVRFSSNTEVSGIRLTVRVEPAPGWVRVNASVSGVPAGERCRLVVVSHTGQREPAASWLVSPAGEKTGTNLDGAALIAPDDVATIEVETFDGRRLAATPL